MLPSQIDRPRIGLALGGGVARGAAHVGALAVLAREGIPIDYVAGTSAGALVGAAFCAGLSLPAMRELARDIGWWRLATPVWPRRGLISFGRLEAWLRELIGDLTFADLPIPFVAVAMDLNNGEMVLLREGALAPAVRASCSVPGFVQPVVIDGRELCDGGVVDNLPVAAVRTFSPDFVIGVDLFEPSYARGWGPLGPGAAAIETLIRQAGAGVHQADCLITPNLSGAPYVRFSRADTFMRLGEEAAEEALPQLKAALAARRG